jgi:GAF domain-containing protein
MQTYIELPELLADAIRAILQDATAPALIEGNASYPLAANEGQRLAAVEKSGLVNTPAEESFDRLTWLAAHCLQMPIALLTLVTPTHQWFKSSYGLDVTGTPRSWSFCNYTILQRGVFSVENLVLDSRFADNPAVAGIPEFRFYAGAPVTDYDGFALGSLCVMDYKPRTLDQIQTRSLVTLAALASNEIRLRATDRQLRWALEALNRHKRRAVHSSG